MENTGKNIELIDQFIANEKKSKIWTIISVCLFLIMASLVLVFSKKLAQTKTKLSVSEQNLKEANDRLRFLNDSIQHVKDSVYQLNLSLELNSYNNKSMIDSIEQVNDTLTVLLNTTQQEFIFNNPGLAREKLNELFQQSFPGANKNISDKISKSIINTNAIIPKAKPLIVSVMYMNRFQNLGNRIGMLLERRRISIERSEPVSGTTFNPSVKYFDDSTKAKAEEITRWLNDAFSSDLKHPFISQFIKIKSPHGHLEIWIGEYEKPKYLDAKFLQPERLNTDK